MHAPRLTPPEGPGMTHDEFVKALNTLGEDAARWRWFKRNWVRVLEWDHIPTTGMELQNTVDEWRRADVGG
jgi:hypothetical protein